MNPSDARPEFQRYQLAFAAHLRDPRRQPRPAGVDARRMKVYAALLYNNVESFLLACFPVLRRTLGTRRWTRLVRTFFATHRCHTPYFRQIPDEFLQFLQSGRTPQKDDPPWLLALAHYEWIELALSVSNRAPDRAYDPAGDLMMRAPVLNPVLASLRYDWPVHRIAPRRRIRPSDTHLLVFRDAEDRVRFSEVNAFTARLLNLLENGTRTGCAALETLAAESGHPDPGLILKAGAALLEDLRTQGAILGA